MMNKLTSSCNYDKELCKRIEQLVTGFLAGQTFIKSCKGKSMYGLRPITYSISNVNVWGPKDENWMVMDIVFDTDIVLRLILDKEKLCVMGVDAAFKFAPNITVSHRLLARS